MGDIQTIFSILSLSVAMIGGLVGLKLPIINALKLDKFHVDGNSECQGCHLYKLLPNGVLNKKYFYAIVWDASKWIKFVEYILFTSVVIFSCVLVWFLGSQHEMYKGTLLVFVILSVFYFVYLLKVVIFNFVILFDMGN